MITLEDIIEQYNKTIRNLEQIAKDSKKRAYGGIIRAQKGTLVEKIGKSLILLALEKLNKDLNIIKFVNKQFKIPINKKYLEKLSDNELKKYIENNINKFHYSYKPDIAVKENENLILVVECKAYTENAMLKRILVDFTLLKSQYPKTKFLLLQLESQLGGDYSLLKEKIQGSPSTHTLFSYFDVELNIITLLKGERKVDKPIHKPDYFKPLERESLEIAIHKISEIIEKSK